MSVTVRAPGPGDGAGEALAESFEAALGTGGEDALMLVAELDGQVAGWLTARIERPAASAARQMVR